MNDTFNTPRPIRVLQIAGGFSKGTSGGVAAFLYNYYKVIDRSQVIFDFLAIGYQCFEPYRGDLENMGSSLYCLNVHEHRGLKGKLTYVKRLSKFLKSHKYDIIHINTGAFYTLFLCSLVAKLKGSGAKVIVHSHSTISYRGVRRLSVETVKPFFKYIADYFFACSTAAGKNVFPSKVILGKRFRMIANAIACENFLYNNEIRSEYRRLFKLNDEFTIGHIGRFKEVKNHTFVIDVFNNIYKKHPKSKLILVGTGDLEETIREKVDTLGLDEVVIFTGFRKDVNKIMQALDVLILPSFREGLPIVTIEAQAAGLPVITSDVVTKEAKVTDMFWQLPLDAGAEKWADTILHLCKDYKRRDTKAEIINAGYDIKESVTLLEDIYKKLVSEL